LIEFARVSKEYHGRRVLRDVTFRVAKGEFVFLTGPSGAGKSTLLKMLFRAETPSEGQILVNGMNVGAMAQHRVPELRRSMGIVFQDYKLLATRTIFENVAFVLKFLGVPPSERKRRAYQMLRLVELHHRLSALPEELSGGEQQRVALARALVNDPDLLVADEPTGNLDHRLAEEVLKLFTQVNVRGTTVLVATHDQDLIKKSGRRCLTLDRGRVVEGLIEAALPPAAATKSGSADPQAVTPPSATPARSTGETEKLRP
jgi:cell division transport system ATP-binding protein